MNQPKSPSGPRFDVPDLELAPPVARPARSTSGGYPAARPAAASAELDDFELMPLGGQLQTAPIAEQLVSTQRAADWPSGRSIPREELPIDPVELRVVTAVGEPPDSLFMTPLYAFQVMQRQGVIKRELRALETEANALELKRDELLAELAQELRPTIEASDTLRRALAPLIEVERVEKERSLALASANAGYRQQLEKFDVELANAAAAIQSAQTSERERTALRDQAEAELKRAEAKQKRVQIEIRSIVDVARRAQPGGEAAPLPPKEAQQVAELEEKVRGFEPEVARLRGELAFAEQELRGAQAETKKRQAALRRIEKEKSAVTGAAEKQLAVRVEGVAEVETQKREALASIGRSVLATQGGLPARPELIEAIRAADAAAHQAAVKAETHLRALDAFDRDRVQQGTLLIGAILALVVLAIVVQAMF